MVSFSAIVASVLVLVAAQPSANAQQQCEEDHECAQYQFCYESRVCAPCLVCAAYNRHEGNMHCAKEWQECGGCLKGFKTEAIPGAIQRGNCLQDPLAHSSGAAGGAENVTSIPQNVVIVVAVAMVVALASGPVYLAIKGRQRMRRQAPDAECGQSDVSDGDTPLMRSAVDLSDQDRPPPGPAWDRDRDPSSLPLPTYSQLKHTASFGAARPSAPPSYHEDTESSSVVCVQMQITEAQEEKRQQAGPFKVPDNVRYRLNAEKGEVEVDDVEEELDETQDASGRSTPVNLNEEESTVPSPWVPSTAGPPHGEQLDDDSGVCNVSESPSSSSTCLHDESPPTLTFRGIFAQGGLAARSALFGQGEAAQTGSVLNSLEAEAGERPAKRFRADSGSHSADSSSSEDDTRLGSGAIGNVLSFVGE